MKSWMQNRSVKGLNALALLICLLTSVLLMSFGGRIPLELKNLETVPCPDTAEFSNIMTSGATTNRANCYFIQGTVINKSGHTLLNADVFGRIFDANGNEVMPERTRLGAIEEVAAGESPFAIRISVPQTYPTPLSLEQFKAAGFGGAIRR